MALPPSTANWHWKNKNITQWGKEWLERELATVSVTGDNEPEVVSVSKVTDIDGDIELGQRKSKLITIFDCKIILKWAGTASDGTEVKGTLTIPEVSHEIICDGLSDFVYEWSLTTDPSTEVNALFTLARSRLPKAIERKLSSFPGVIIDIHGKDLTVSADPSRSGTPAPGIPTSVPVASSSFSTSTARPKAAEKNVNTTTVVVEADFQASAEDLFGLLTDAKRIPMWTRAPAVSLAQPGTEYSLFGGGVKGRYITLKPQKEIVQTWALQSPTWPSDHDAILTTTLNQSTDTTKIIFSLVGVPLGSQDEIKRNLEGYYIHGFKSIGYVHLIPSAPVYSSSYIQYQSKLNSAKNFRGTCSFLSPYVPALVMAALVLAIAFLVPYFSVPFTPVPSSQ